MRTHRSNAVVSALLAALVPLGAAMAVPRAALGQTTDKPSPEGDKAAAYFKQGSQAFANEKYLVAIAAFEEAYKLDPPASVVYALALSYQRQFLIDHDPAKLRRATKLFGDYLDLPDASKAAASRKDKALEYLAELRPEVAKLDEEAAKSGRGAEPAPPPPARTALILSSPVDGARVAFDGGAEKDMPAVIDTSVGRHKIRVSAPGYKPVERDATAVDGQSLPVEVPLEELPAKVLVQAPASAQVAVDGRVVGKGGTPIAFPAGRHRLTVVQNGRYPMNFDIAFERNSTALVEPSWVTTRQRKVAETFLVGGGVLLVAGGVTTLLAYSAEIDAQAFDTRLAMGDKTTTVADLNAYNDSLSRRDAWRTTTYVLFGVSAAAVATGALLWFIDTPRIEEGGPAMTPAVTPTVGPGAVGMSWQGRF